MQFLLPAGLGLLALAIPILLLYMLRLRRRQVCVSSTLLWMQLLRDRQANSPWQKLRRNLLLILQLFALTALAAAAAHPAVLTRTVASGAAIVLLDGSASMQATDFSPSRFEVARRTVRTLIAEMPADTALTLILVGRTPRLLAAAETDRSVLLRALDRARATSESADWQAAFALAAGAGTDSREPSVVIVSDGGLPTTGLPALPGQVHFVPVGRSGDNLALTALALRSTSGGPQLFAEISNFSASDRSVRLTVYFGDRLLTARQLDLPAGSRHGLSFDELPDAAGIYRAQISSQEEGRALDQLELDNTAYAVHAAASQRRVLLVSGGNLFLEQLLASLPGVRAFKALPAPDGSFSIPDDPFELYILDGIVPDPLPAGNLLLVQPAGNPLFEVGGTVTDLDSLQVNEGPLTRHVDWSNVHILQARAVQTPEWAEVLVEAGGRPLIFVGETNGRRVAAVLFDLRQSDLPLQLAYPILFSQMIDFLAPPGAFDASAPLQPGQALQITPPPGTERVVVAAPSGDMYEIALHQSRLTFAQTEEPGYYAVNFLAGDSNSAEFFAVNLFDAAESDIQPRESLQVGQAVVHAQASGQVGRRELWPLLAALTLLVLLVEWQYDHRRQLPILRVSRV